MLPPQQLLLLLLTNTYIINVFNYIYKIKQSILCRGILADEMGMGKTIEMLSLIVAQYERGGLKPLSDDLKNGGTMKTGGTLIVVPLMVVSQWQSEIERFLDPSSRITVLVHYGNKRTKSSIELSSYDIVITSYQTMSYGFETNKVY